jgi:CubicO group peptidase (beta-lactamase class C family)
VSYSFPAFARAARPACLTVALAVLGLACADPVSAPPAAPASGSAQIVGLPAGLSEDAVRAHVIAPSHIRDVRTEETDPAAEVSYAPELAPPAAPAVRAAPTTLGSPTVSLGALGLKIHTKLKDSVAGYMLEVRQNGTLVHVGQWNWTQTPADAGTGWTENRRMHVASVSKFLTAVAMVKLLDSKGISYDSKIINYLPTYWPKGANIGQITFRHLLTHRSGFYVGGSSTDFAFMKSRVAAGVPFDSIGKSHYHNMNFGLMRILIPIINGDVAKGTIFSNLTAVNDQAWDVVTVGDYKTYMQAKVFTPAGVANASFAPVLNGANALAYKGAYAWNTEVGWNSGDLATVAGGAGWRLTPKEVLSVMNHVRRMNTIITPLKAQYMLDNYFGIDQAISSAAGTLYNKNGAWGWNGKTEQCVAFFLPNGMELVLFVNSPVGKTGFSLRNIVTNAYIASLSP